MTVTDAVEARTLPRIRGAVVVLVDAHRERAESAIAELERRGHIVTVVQVPPLSIDVLRTTLGRLSRAPLQTAMRLLRHPRVGLAGLYLADQLPRLGAAHIHSFVSRAVTSAAKIDCTAGELTAELLRELDEHPGADPDTIDEILALDWSAYGAKTLAIRRLHVRAGSIIAELTIDDGATRREVVLKKQRVTPVDPRPASESAEIEYAMLSGLHRSMTTTRDGSAYTVPRALLLDVPRATVVMDRASGTPLDRIISAARRRRKIAELDLPLRRAGYWLRFMQQHTRSDEDGRHILTSLVHLALQDLELVVQHDRVLRTLRGKIIDYVRSLESRVAGGSLPVVGHHGDLWPGNLFIADRSVEVIDFEGFREGLPLEDVVYLLSYLELLPLAGRDYPRMERAFLSGFLDGDALDPCTLELFRVMHAIRTLARMVNDQPSLRTRAVRRKLKRTVIRSVR
ncbi:MAG TPA: phosphotransferase [Thermoanaerobaculia bacterium]|jgi:hypothetical protein